MSSGIHYGKHTHLTEAEKRSRIRRAAAMSREGYEGQVIAKRLKTTMTKIRRWCQELGIEWSGKPANPRRDTSASRRHS